MTAVLNAANEAANEMFRNDVGEFVIIYCFINFRTFLLLKFCSDTNSSLLFTNEGLGFLDIPKLIEGAMEAHKEEVKIDGVTLDDILSSDEWARAYVEKNAAGINNSEQLFV